ncbi:MAG: DNA polymerase III subunit gamma/tau [Alphaproteobacteria bacterium]|nr:DNA polymerase III subunit gamma/tau [Alphaproteobacteria bacterium]
MTDTSHVLARKYRPQIFADLIGQEALVRTITNAIAMNRIANAYMLTGIRGVGKTSSARIIAKGLNCVGEDGNGGMTPNPCGKCRHCVDIANDSHIDVIEIDAASNTGVDNVREIIESAQYNPVSARYKIYIIDEVHMLSKQAFNALLKTLEEPPERIKFIFATTEIRKVPITILSRCQRFDLRRIDEQTLTEHLARIAGKEGVSATREALQIIARAGDGSVRDALSLLDQAMTQLQNTLTADNVRAMLGLADRVSLFDLYDAMMRGDVAGAFELLETQYAHGADPLVVIQDLLELTHWLTRVKVVPALIDDAAVPEAERVRGKAFAEALSMATLTAAWQMLLKGIGELKAADNPFQALEMIVIRLAYMSDLPSPVQLVEEIKKGGASSTPAPKPKHKTPAAESVQAPAAPAAAETPAPSRTFQTLAEIAQAARDKGERMLGYNLDKYVRPVGIVETRIQCAFIEGSPRALSAELVKFLEKETGVQWIVESVPDSPAQTAQEAAAERHLARVAEVRQDPLVAGILNAFGGAKLNKIKDTQPASAAPDDEVS